MNISIFYIVRVSAVLLNFLKVSLRCGSGWGVWCAMCWVLMQNLFLTLGCSKNTMRAVVLETLQKPGVWMLIKDSQPPCNTKQLNWDTAQHQLVWLLYVMWLLPGPALNIHGHGRQGHLGKLMNFRFVCLILLTFPFDLRSICWESICELCRC